MFPMKSSTNLTELRARIKYLAMVISEFEVELDNIHIAKRSKVITEKINEVDRQVKHLNNFQLEGYCQKLEASYEEKMSQAKSFRSNNR